MDLSKARMKATSSEVCLLLRRSPNGGIIVPLPSRMLTSNWGLLRAICHRALVKSGILGNWSRTALPVPSAP